MERARDGLFTEPAREAREVERWNRFHPLETPRTGFVGQCLEGAAPVIAATDYVCAYPQSIAAYLSTRFVALGTDGSGRSDTRAALRSFFELNQYHIAIAALRELSQKQVIVREIVAQAIAKYSFNTEAAAPWLR